MPDKSATVKAGLFPDALTIQINPKTKKKQ